MVIRPQFRPQFPNHSTVSRCLGHADPSDTSTSTCAATTSFLFLSISVLSVLQAHGLTRRQSYVQIDGTFACQYCRRHLQDKCDKISRTVVTFSFFSLLFSISSPLLLPIYFGATPFSLTPDWPTRNTIYRPFPRLGTCIRKPPVRISFPLHMSPRSHLSAPQSKSRNVLVSHAALVGMARPALSNRCPISEGHGVISQLYGYFTNEYNPPRSLSLSILFSLPPVSTSSTHSHALHIFITSLECRCLSHPLCPFHIYVILHAPYISFS